MYTTATPDSIAFVWAIFNFFFVTILIPTICMSALMVVAVWFIYNKAKEPGWAALIPFYNSYVLYKITWGSGWFFLLLFIPFASIVIQIITAFKLAKVFGKGVGYGFGLWLIPIVFYPILGFGKAEYVGLNKGNNSNNSSESNKEESKILDDSSNK